MKLRVTHIKRSRPRPDHWVPLLTVTREAGALEGPFYFGFELTRPVTGAKLQDLVVSGELVTLQFPCDINQDQQVWLSPAGDVWLASATSPAVDPYRILLDSIAHADMPIFPPEFPDGFEPIGQVIARRRVLLCADGGYLAERTLYSNFAQLVASRLMTAAGAVDISYLRRVLWNGLATQMCQNAFDFCKDPYFAHGPRKHLIDVVQFGTVYNFACIANTKDIDQIKGFLTATEMTVEGRFRKLLENHTSAIEVGLYTETAASNEFVRQLKDIPAILERRSDCRSEQELGDFLRAAPSQSVRLVVCDQGIARKVIDLARGNQWGWDFEKVANFSYAEPVRVGFVYPLADRAWRDCIRACLRNFLESDNPAMPWDPGVNNDECIRTDLKRVGIEALSLPELRATLGLADVSLRIASSKRS